MNATELCSNEAFSNHDASTDKHQDQSEFVTHDSTGSIYKFIMMILITALNDNEKLPDIFVVM